MKPSESNIINLKCNSINVKEIKKTVYRDLEIYAVKRSTAYSNTECAWLDGTNTAWWCGYVEVPTAMDKLLKPRGYLDEEILYSLSDPDSYNLEVVHGGYTYLDYGIPCVLADNQRIFLGWDYNHSGDTESCVTYDDIINEGKKVIDSMFKKIERNNNEYTYDNVIINPTQEGIESLIGKEVYYSDVPFYCIGSANENYKIGILREVRNNEAAPFYIENPMGYTLNYACIIPKKEEPKPKYVPFENQKEFVRAYQKFKESITCDTFENNLADYGIWVKNKNGISCAMVLEIWDEGVALGGETQSIYWRDLFEYYTFPDGSPCGKLEENK